MFSFLATLAFALLASGCGKDRTPEDYADEQTSKEFARVQAAAGSYRGTLTNQATGETLGAVEINLQATLVPVQGGTGNTSRAVLRGGVNITTGGVVTSATIDNAAFLKAGGSDDEGGTISGSMTVPLGTSSAAFQLTAKRNGASLSGVIVSTDRAGVSGAFVAERDALLPRTGQNSTIPGGPEHTLRYKGQAYVARCAEPQWRNTIFCQGPDPTHVDVAMAVNYAPVNSGYAFVNLFSSVTVVNVVVRIARMDIQIATAEIDRRTNRLAFSGTPQNGGSPVILDCAARGAGYSCTLTTNGITYPYDLTQI